jgi:hypothetical protein
MVNKSMIFDDNWLENARAKSNRDSWVDGVIDTLDTTGQIYLSTLRLWFDRFPLTAKEKNHLRVSLESLQDADHLGGVNELAWWEFMQREEIKGQPLPSSPKPCPDFQLEPPADCFVEVSTLNVSGKDKAQFKDGHSVALDHDETIRRVIGKLTDEKRRQLTYAADRKKAGVLALFDYTEWSGFGTQFFRALGDELLGTQFEFKNLPSELSAIIYLERKVLGGEIGLSRSRSVIYYNPLATYPLRAGVFSSFGEFSCQLVSIEPRLAEHRIWLSSRETVET